MGDTEAMRQTLERIADGQCRADDLRHCGCLLNVQIAKEALAALASTEAPVGDRLASLLEKLKPYLEHAVQCGRYDIPSTGPCECGLDALWAEIGDET